MNRIFRESLSSVGSAIQHRLTKSTIKSRWASKKLAEGNLVSQETVSGVCLIHTSLSSRGLLRKTLRSMVYANKKGGRRSSRG